MKKFICIKECYGKIHDYEINDIVHLDKKDDMFTVLYASDETDAIQTWIFDEAFKEVVEPLEWEYVGIGTKLEQITKEKVCIDTHNLDNIFITKPHIVEDKGEQYLLLCGIIVVHKDNIHHFKEVNSNE